MSKKSSQKIELSGFATYLAKFKKTTLAKFIQENIIFVSGIVIGSALLIAGIVQLFGSAKNNNQIEIIPPTSQNSGGQIIVDVAGAVKKPGVYSLEGEVRVGAGIEAAGGLTPDADFSWIAKNLNLAAKIADGAKIYIPQKGDIQIQEFSSQSLSPVQQGKININTASQAQLEALPAVGPVTAGKIISARPYNQPEDLLVKKVVGKSTFEKIKGLISVF